MLTQRAGLRRILGNSAWLLGDHAVRLGVGMFVGIWTARYLGPQDFGVLSFGVALVAMLGPLAALGLDTILVRRLVQAPRTRDAAIVSALAVKFGASLLVTLMAIVLVALLRPDDVRAQAIVALLAAGSLFNCLNVCDAWFAAQTRSRHIVVARNLAFLLLAAVRVALLVSSQPVQAFAAALAAETVVAGLLVLHAYRTHAGRLHFGAFSLQEARELLSDAWPLLLSGFAVILYARIDVVMLGKMRGDSEVGIYAAAVALSEAFYFLPMILASSTLPAILGARQSDPARYRARLEELYFSASWAAIILAAMLFALAPWLVNLLYGPAYRAAVAVLQIHLWALIPVFVGVVTSQYLVAENLQMLSLARTTAGLVVNVALNLLLIPRHGAVGAAVATLISYTLATYLPIAISRTHAHWRTVLRAPFAFGTLRRLL